jgi:uncharacterized membrane protein YedE/YeeE
MNFTDANPFIAAAVGGVLIGLSAFLMMWLIGRIAGVSGIAAGIMSSAGKDNRSWRFAFVAGLVLAGFALQSFASATTHQSISPLMLLAAGLLVGFGSVLGSGCTSGHGVCGLGRRSVRSLVATLTFMGAAFVTVFLLRHIFT